MSLPVQSALHTAVATQSFVAIAVANAIVTSTASAITVTTLTPASGFASTTSGIFGLVRRNVTVTTAAHAASYKTGAGSAIVVTGTDVNGAVQTESLLLTQAGGNETVAGLLDFATVTKIVIPGQNDALGAFTFGVQDIFCQCRDVAVGTSGTLVVKYQYKDTLDTIPAEAIAHWGSKQSIQPSRIYSTSTATNIVLLF